MYLHVCFCLHFSNRGDGFPLSKREEFFEKATYEMEYFSSSDTVPKVSVIGAKFRFHINLY